MSNMHEYIFRNDDQQLGKNKDTNYDKSTDVCVVEWAAVSTAGVSNLKTERRDESAPLHYAELFESPEEGALPMLQANSIHR